MNLKPKSRYKRIKWLFGKEIEIPEEWEISGLGKLCDKPKYGANVSAVEKNNKLPRYIRITDINDDGSLQNSEWKSIYKDAAKDYFLAENDVLFARTGATVGKTYLHNELNGICAFAGYLIKFTPHPKKLFPIFLFYYTHSSLYWKWLHSVMTWGVQPNVNAEQYSNLPILKPPLQEQKQIASILSNVDASIKATQQIIEKMERLKKGLMQELLTKGIGHAKSRLQKPTSGYKLVTLNPKILKFIIPEEWDFVKFNKLTLKITDGTHFTPKYLNEGIPFLRVTDIQTKTIEWKSVKKISRVEHVELIKRCNPEKGDILFSKNGTVGITTIVDMGSRI